MAVKKTATKTGGEKAAPKKAPVKQAAPKKATPKADAAKAAPKAAPPKAKPKADAAPKKKAAPVKLTDGQTGLLKKVGEATEGYIGTKAEGRSLEALAAKKLVKRGAKDKATGAVRYTVSKAGEKHLGSTGPATGA